MLASALKQWRTKRECRPGTWDSSMQGMEEKTNKQERLRGKDGRRNTETRHAGGMGSGRTEKKKLAERAAPRTDGLGREEGQNWKKPKQSRWARELWERGGWEYRHPGGEGARKELERALAPVEADKNCWPPAALCSWLRNVPGLPKDCLAPVGPCWPLLAPVGPVSYQARQLPHQELWSCLPYLAFPSRDPSLLGPRTP